MRSKLLCLTAVLGFPSVFPAAELPRPEHGLHYTKPAVVWDEALPLRNGIMGALFWGNGAPAKISLDQGDLWDLRPVPEFKSAEYRFRTMREWHLQGRVHEARLRPIIGPGIDPFGIRRGRQGIGMAEPGL